MRESNLSIFSSPRETEKDRRARKQNLAKVDALLKKQKNLPPATEEEMREQAIKSAIGIVRAEKDYDTSQYETTEKTMGKAYDTVKAELEQLAKKAKRTS